MSITVIIPTYNYGRFIESALLSVLLQDFRPLEVIVVNDGSTDDTDLVCEKVRKWLTDHQHTKPDVYQDVTLMLVHRENDGPSAARNTGLNLATGDYIAFLDADDLYPAGRLSDMVDFLEENPSYDMVFGLAQIIPDAFMSQIEIHCEDLNAKHPDIHHPINNTFQTKRMPGVHTGVYRKKAFSKVGKFDESLRYYEDIDWLLRAEHTGMEMFFTEQVVLYHRNHAGSMTSNIHEMRKGHLNFIRKLRNSNQTLPDSFNIKWNFSP